MVETIKADIKNRKNPNQRRNKKLSFIKEIVGDKVTIIASGGVMSASDYLEKIDAGADLVQIYTGFIFEGPQLIQDILFIDSP